MERETGDTADPQGSTPGSDVLEVLRWNWGAAYEITMCDGDYQARRHDGLGGLITSPDPGELRTQIISDYITKPVPRIDGTTP